MELLVNYGIRASGGAEELIPIAPLTFNYTGAAQTITLNPGIYTFEAWGGSAEDNTGTDPTYGGTGRGAYTKGDIEITSPTTFYVYVGEGAFNGIRTTSTSDPAAYGFNGNAAGGRFDASWSRGYSSGGAATDIRLSGGAWNDTTGLRSRIMVAGGAGPNKNGGTLTGLTGWTDPRGGAGGAGTQTSGGAAGGSGAGVGIFGRGGIGYISQPGCPNCNSASGSGSGYYGGGGGWGNTCQCSPRSSGSGGSGSSFISGHTGCNAVNSSGGHTGQPNHYSGLVFTNTVMTSGLGEFHSFVGTASGRNPAATGHGKVVISGSEWGGTPAPAPTKYRYWRYVEGAAKISHHPRVSRIDLTGDGTTRLITYTSDNCSDQGTYQVGTVSIDLGAGNEKLFTGAQIYSTFANSSSLTTRRASVITVEASNNNSTWTKIFTGVAANFNYPVQTGTSTGNGVCGLFPIYT